ncbi:LPS assembly protein LptD [Alteromonas mediterranea]|uniref:LPS assembly protein LptD n=1 Tax=Alteromonas mediterranea TaxID=314275 RepID=UPI0012FAED17|nr:LPS assembly protein LptD [Alteromonas mediterranea]QGX60770.1 LPS assembly protein LptD [Alteromonas mediterranea]
MKKTCAMLVSATLLPTVAFAQETTASNSKPDSDAVPLAFCSVEPVTFSSQTLMPKGHVKVEANRTEIIQDTVALFSGNVDITSDTAVISASQAQVNGSGRDLIAKGDVTYQDAQLKVESDVVTLRSEEERLEMQNTRYQLTGFVGQGSAKDIVLDTDTGIVLKEVSFTTCPEGDEDWLIRASEISLEKGTVWGQAKHTRFYIADVPVFYLPYFAFPVSNERQTGLLFPELTSSSRTGVDYTQPFYWNIAPNYDMTISPRLMSLRGLQLNTEFRYLTARSQGKAYVEYLPSDSDITGNPDRYFYRFEHQGLIADNWLLNVDFNGLSDDNYLVDLGSDYYSRADTHLYRSVGLSYYSTNLSVNMHIKDFEVLGDTADSYRAVPEIKVNYTKPLGEYFEFNLDSEVAHFDNTLDTAPTATRFHVAPTLAMPLRAAWGEFVAETTLFQTVYQQDNVEGTDLKEDVERTLGQARLYGALYFERDTSWFSDDMSMTLEPKVQYLYTSYEDQTAIGFYDSTPLLTDVEGLFRGQEFTGLDRISDNNQITLGATTRMLDKNNREQFVLSVGQIFYLEDNEVVAATKNQDRSALAAEVDWRFNNNWFFHSDVQVTTDTDKVDLSSVGIEYRKDDSRFIQLSHRYVRDLSGETIDQIGISASWPISENWQWVGRTYRDLERNRSVETYAGIQYESCCWAVRLVAQRSLNNRYNDSGQQTTDDFDSGISLQFIFKGIGSSGTQRSMLQDGMFGYRQPYSLN